MKSKPREHIMRTNRPAAVYALGLSLPAVALLSSAAVLPAARAQEVDRAIERYVERQRRQISQATEKTVIPVSVSDRVGLSCSVTTRSRERIDHWSVVPDRLWLRTAHEDVEPHKPIFACSFPEWSAQGGPDTQPSEKSPERPAASDGEHGNLAEINNKLNNPGADLASLNFKFTWNQFEGDLPGSSAQDSLALDFQPVFPFKLDDHGSNFLVRPTFPLVWRPHYNARDGGFDGDFGLGDTQLVMFYAHTNEDTGFFWGAGPTMQFPTHTDDSLGTDAFLLGPAAYCGVTGEWGILGVFPQHWWNIDGGDGYTAFTAIQPFYWFNVGEGYQIGGAPIITYNWAADDGDQAWTVPINLGVGKTVKIGDTPVKFKFEAIYYIEQPDAFGPHWGLQLTITPVIPNPFDALFARK